MVFTQLGGSLAPRPVTGCNGGAVTSCRGAPVTSRTEGAVTSRTGGPVTSRTGGSATRSRPTASSSDSPPSCPPPSLPWVHWQQVGPTRTMPGWQQAPARLAPSGSLFAPCAGRVPPPGPNPNPSPPPTFASFSVHRPPPTGQRQHPLGPTMCRRKGRGGMCPIQRADVCCGVRGPWALRSLRSWGTVELFPAEESCRGRGGASHKSQVTADEAQSQVPAGEARSQVTAAGAHALPTAVAWPAADTVAEAEAVLTVTGDSPTVTGASGTVTEVLSGGRENGNSSGAHHCLLPWYTRRPHSGTSPPTYSDTSTSRGSHRDPSPPALQ